MAQQDSDTSPDILLPEMLEPLTGAATGGDLRATGVVRRSEPTAADALFVSAMQQAGLLGELEAEELRAILELLDAPDGPRRRLDLVEHYYAAGGRREASARRVLADRFFVHKAETPGTAREIVERLSGIAPEVGSVNLERIGVGDDADGPLVLRAGDHFAAVIDEYEETLDTDEIDLREIDPAETITIRGLVRALNVLLERNGIRERLVQLRSDGERESYVAASAAAAMTLCQSGFLEDEEPEDLIDLASW